MRLIDADALVAKMNLAIAMLKRTMKNFDIENDPECQMELKTYQNIRDRIKEEPTVKPKRGKWEFVQYDANPKIGNYHCSQCGLIAEPLSYCPNCGAKMEGGETDEAD